MVNKDLSVLGDLAYDWPELKSIGIMVNISQNSVHTTEENMSVRFYISLKELSAQELHDATRSHWSIEVQLHWKLDVGMNEDASRIRRDEAGENFAAIRHIALNLLNADKSFKAGLKRKRTKVGRNNSYLSRVLTGQGTS